MRSSQKGKARLTIPRRKTRRKIASCVDTAIAALAEFRKRCGAPDAKPMPSIPLVGAGRRASAKTRSESGAIPLYNDEDQTLGGMTAEDMEDQDFIEGVDEDGNKVLLQVVRYFFYNGEEYVVLGDAQTEAEALALSEQLQAEQERRARLEADRRRTSEVDDLMDRLARRP